MFRNPLPSNFLLALNSNPIPLSIISISNILFSNENVMVTVVALAYLEILFIASLKIK